jgi:hypothetical protein
MIKIKRIKNKEDLLDALNMIYEDMATFKLGLDAKDKVSDAIKIVESWERRD